MLTQNLAAETVLLLTHEDVFAQLPNKPNQTKNHNMIACPQAHHIYSIECVWQSNDQTNAKFTDISIHGILLRGRGKHKNKSHLLGTLQAKSCPPPPLIWGICPVIGTDGKTSSWPQT